MMKLAFPFFVWLLAAVNARAAAKRGLSRKSEKKRIHKSGVMMMKGGGKGSEPMMMGAAKTSTFSTYATGAQEVPEVDTMTTARVAMTIDEGLSMIGYDLSVFQGHGIVQAHLHCQVAGQNGPVIAFLFQSEEGVNVDGHLSSGVLKNADLLETDCGTNIASLTEAMLYGSVYLNVHSVDYPNGVVRGQVGTFLATLTCDDEEDEH
ncbi:hypothetical protein ACA910_010190 [Epithemia clementina (nom. ined.)]